MKKGWRNFALFVWAVTCTLLIGACSDNSSWRFDPGIPGKPVGLAANPGNGLVTLSWTPADNVNYPVAYQVYYATTPGVTAATGTLVPGIKNTSTTVTGLSNDVSYYFAVSAVSISGESSLSDQVVSVPSLPGAFKQSDLQGSWQFNALVSGAGAGWMRGTAAIDAAGKVSVASFLDSAGGSVAPANLFTTMTITPDGTVVQSGAAAGFQGSLSVNQNKDTLVASAGTGSASRMLVILQKQVAGVTFSSSDIKGTGKTVAGPLSFVYHQLSSGPKQEWEYASGQVGQDQTATYLTLTAPTARQLPAAGGKATSWTIASDGTVTETPIPGALPQPAALLSHGVMSADKMTIVGTMTDANGAFLIRVLQMIHPPSTAVTASSYLLADLAGSYSLHTLVSSPDPLWAYGTLSVAATGEVTFPFYLDSKAGTTAPAAFSLALDQQGALTNAADPSYHGKLSYFRDLNMMVSTRTDAAGGSALDIALRR